MKKISLSKAFPLIASQWDFSKNDPIKPGEVTRATSKKFWWKCPKGHSYYSSVAHRTVSGSGCPYCAHGRVTDKNNLEHRYPDLVKEWDYKKNNIKPNEVSFKSQYRVFWICKNKHSWSQGIISRVKEIDGKGKYRINGCPKCSSFAVENKELLNEWNYKRNKGINPEDFRSISNKKVWWRCKKGHEWEALIANRFHGAGCSICNSANSTSKLELRVYAELLSVFDIVEHRKKIDGDEIDMFVPLLNIGVEVDGVFWHKNKKLNDINKGKRLKKLGIDLYRIREKGLKKISKNDIILKAKDIKYSNVVELLNKISEKHKLPLKVKEYFGKGAWVNEGHYREFLEIFPNPFVGKSLAEQFPEISLEWSDKNLPLEPINFSSGSHEKIWWKCKGGHEWRAPIKERALLGHGCPFCSGNRVSNLNSLESKFPDLIKEWDYKKNIILPEEVSFGSRKKIWWKCPKGHSYELSIKQKCIGQGCTVCSGKKTIKSTSFKAKFPEKAKYWNVKKNSNLKPDQIAPFSNKKVWWKCAKGHEWEATPAKISIGRWCPVCAKNRN